MTVHEGIDQEKQNKKKLGFLQLRLRSAKKISKKDLYVPATNFFIDPAP